MNITPNPIVTIELAITLTETEARAILVDARQFQDHLRTTLAKHKGKTAPKESKAPTGGVCPKCKRVFTSAKRLQNHLARCPAIAPAATA